MLVISRLGFMHLLALEHVECNTAGAAGNFFVLPRTKKGGQVRPDKVFHNFSNKKTVGGAQTPPPKLVILWENCGKPLCRFQIKEKVY